MKEIDFDLENNPFMDFLSSRYSMTAKLDVEKLWNFSKENDLSFFVLSLGALLNAVNKVPVLRRRIINGKVIEYDYLDGVTPLMDEEKSIFREMRVDVPEKFDSILDWHDYVKEHQQNVLYGENHDFNLDMMKRDEENIVNLSCIPWVDFDSMTNCVASSNQIQPLITWGKVNDDYKMAVSITVNHIFVNGRDIAYFFEHLQDNLDDVLAMD